MSKQIGTTAEFSLREMEAAVYIAITAGTLLHVCNEQITVEDSRELVDFIVESSRKFEKAFQRDLSFGKCSEYDYIDRVAMFADKSLRKAFPTQ